MKRHIALALIVGATLTSLSALYGVVWAATWMLGDRSYFIAQGSGGSFTTSYPGVFLGGLPPIPSSSSPYLEIGTLVLGSGALCASAAALVASHRYWRDGS